MTQDEFQGLVLQELKEIKTDIGTLKSDVSTLKSDVSGLKSDAATMNNKIDAIDARLERVENKQTEQGDILSALLHNQEVARAEIEALTATTATNTSIQRLDTKFSLLDKRLSEQETNLEVLKLAK